MKKFISLATAAVLLLSGLCLSLSAATTYIPTPAGVRLLENEITLDGSITNDEWGGTPCFTFGPATCATIRDLAPSPDNTWYDDTMSNLSDDEKSAMSTSVWLCWDTEYLYVGAVVTDPDGNFNDWSDVDNIWNGDNFQFRIDPQGPNSGMLRVDPDYDWTTTPFDHTIIQRERGEKVTNNDLKKFAWNNPELLADYTFTYCTKYGEEGPIGYNDGWDYGAEVPDYAITTVEDPVTYVATTTYEIKIAWSDIAHNFPDFKAEENVVLGAVFAVCDSYMMTLQDYWRQYDSCYTFGGGLYGNQFEYGEESGIDSIQTFGGTAAIKLLGANEVVKPPVSEDKPDVDEPQGGDIDVDITAKDNYFSIPVKVKDEYLTAGELSFTLSFDSAMAEFDSIRGIDEGAYKLEKKDDGSYVVTITDLKAVKSLKAGDTLLEITLKGDNITDVSALSFKIQDKYVRVTAPATGDSYMIIAIVTVCVMTLGCALIVTKKRTVR